MKSKHALVLLEIALEYVGNDNDQELYKLIADEMNKITAVYDEDDEYDLSLTIIQLMSKARRIK